jgi:hypothetical protein
MERSGDEEDGWEASHRSFLGRFSRAHVDESLASRSGLDSQLWLDIWQGQLNISTRLGRCSQ